MRKWTQKVKLSLSEQIQAQVKEEFRRETQQ